MKMIIKNTTTGTAWNLPDGAKMPKGQYADLSYVETLSDELKADIKRDMKSNDSRLYMNEHFDMKHVFIIEKQSMYAKDAIDINGIEWDENTIDAFQQSHGRQPTADELDGKASIGWTRNMVDALPSRYKDVGRKAKRKAGV
ncbi:hypothetical protein [Vibrio cyclitrophicus]|uniref:hypothetical protein n=1 Tax=Vibrio cyclitrophicus TaxID=47951 RepID=UPI000C85FFD2|nr:hypothetical protein [Vibrio cyclitrophicus]PMH47841.1 hypothetical protein BCU67_20350 [Vibrio cyclitrophicus]